MQTNKTQQGGGCTDEFSEEDQGTGQSPHPLSSFLSNASNACPHLLEVAMCV